MLQIHLSPAQSITQSSPGRWEIINPITHFEIYGGAPARLAEFYRVLFGWEVNQAPGIDYWRIQTGTSEANSLSGGLTYRPDCLPPSWVNYVKVASLDEVIAQVQHLGGKILRPKTAVPKTAWCVVVEDPQGNVFAVWEPDPLAFPPPEPDWAQPGPCPRRSK